MRGLKVMDGTVDELNSYIGLIKRSREIKTYKEV
jgi:cob(I)alamin adenosyltransferase